jgi:hypothetical protein
VNLEKERKKMILIELFDTSVIFSLGGPIYFLNCQLLYIVLLLCYLIIKYMNLEKGEDTD